MGATVSSCAKLRSSQFVFRRQGLSKPTRYRVVSLQNPPANAGGSDQEGKDLMYCATCGTPLAPGLSYCNRCGASLKERSESHTGSIAAFLTAITLIGLIGMGIMLGGMVTLSTEAHLGEPIVGFYMLFTFLIVAITEILLVRQLSRFTSSSERKVIDIPQPPAMPGELRPAQPRTLAEPMQSVTENTTRTLDYSRNEPLR